MIPKTADGRVLFAIPWHGALIVGTTDGAVDGASAEPRALAKEKKFLFEHITRYFGRKPQVEEILSVWSGLRPLVKKGGVKTSKLSRDHTILVSQSGLITVTGGKWTTYRRMGQDTINRACEVASLPKAPSRTLELKIHGWTMDAPENASEWERVYGSDLSLVRGLSSDGIDLDAPLIRGCPSRRATLCGRHGMKWRGRWRMCWRGERVHCSSMRAHQSKRHRRWHALWPRDWQMRQWKAKELANFSDLASGYFYRDSDGA